MPDRDFLCVCFALSKLTHDYRGSGWGIYVMMTVNFVMYHLIGLVL